MRDILRKGAEEMGLALSEEQLDLFYLYARELDEQGKYVNLTAIKGDEEVARLHFLDSLRIGAELPLGGKKMIDIGSGAGFPGIPLKILCPSLELTAVDAVGKKVDFMASVCSKMGLDVNCLHARAEELAQDADYREQYDYAVSRAVTTINILAELCLPFVKTGCLLVAMKTPESAQREISEAKRAFKELSASILATVDYTLGDAVHTLVLIRKDGPSPKKYPRRFSRIKSDPL